jgi:hypothetical protein
MNTNNIFWYSFIYTKFQQNPPNSFLNETLRRKDRRIQSLAMRSSDILCVKQTNYTSIQAYGLETNAFHFVDTIAREMRGTA